MTEGGDSASGFFVEHIVDEQRRGVFSKSVMTTAMVLPRFCISSWRMVLNASHLLLL